MIFSLLEGETPAGGNNGYNWIMLAILGVLIVVVAVMYFLGNKKRKKQEQDAKDLINAVRPGNKVKTIGGVCGIVVEVDDEESTFVLETGTELSGKSYIKFDKQAIYQTDAVVAKPETNVTVAEEPEEPEVNEPTELSANIETSENSALSATETAEEPADGKKAD